MNYWFWEVSPRYWRPIHWGIFFGGIALMFAVCIFGCGIESIADLFF